MTKGDTIPIKFADLAEALVLLTRLPVQMGVPRGAQTAWAWPLVGLVVGGLAALVAAIGWALGLPVDVVAGLALVTQAIVTGAMHEDGLADCADGFWGGQTPERRLEIMKDSRIGAYGVLALIFVVLLKWQALTYLMTYGHFILPLLAVGLFSRLPMLVLMHYLAFARQDGLARHVGQPEAATVGIGAVVAVLVAIFLTGYWAIALVIVSGLVTIVCGRLALAKIGGQTGDVHGGAQQLTELAVLFALCALI